MEKIKKMIPFAGDTMLVVEIDNHSAIIITKDANSKITLDGQPTTHEAILAKFNEGVCLCVEPHPLVERYGASLQAEFTTCC